MYVTFISSLHRFWPATEHGALIKLWFPDSVSCKLFEGLHLSIWETYSTTKNQLFFEFGYG